jgi:hypothetical protein
MPLTDTACVLQPVDPRVVGAVHTRQHHARRARAHGVHPAAHAHRQRAAGHVAGHARAGRRRRRGVPAARRGDAGRQAQDGGQPQEGV